MTVTYTPIASQTLATAAASVTFSSIPQDYRDLVLVVQAVGNVQETRLRFNNDTSSSYNKVNMVGASFGTFSGALANQTSLVLSETARGPNVIAQIMDYSATDKHKSVLSRANSAGVANDAVEAIAGRFANTAAITVISIGAGGTFASANYPIGTVFSLYGIAA